eukprot:197981_1
MSSSNSNNNKKNMGGWITKVIAVPTKSGDEVVNSSRTQANPERDNDAFSYYSSDQVRIQTLMLSTGRVTNRQEQQQQQQHQERKTRISFELHPSLILEDLLDELAEEEKLFVDGDEIIDIDMDMLDLLQDNLRVRASSPRSVTDVEGTNFAHDA